MNPEFILVGIFFVGFFITFAVVASRMANNTSLMMGMQVKPVLPDDFLRLIDKENSPVVFSVKSMFGTRYYFATIKSDKICTKSKHELQFPASCEIIPLQRF